MNVEANDHCPRCGARVPRVFVHGHYQCQSCRSNIDDCCPGEVCEIKTENGGVNIVSFIKNLWDGNRGLAFTYWVIYFIGNLIFSILMGFGDAMNLVGEEILQVLLPLMALAYIYFFYAAVCVWSSASNYEGEKLWAILAKVSIGLGVLFRGLEILQTLDEIPVLSLIAS